MSEIGGETPAERIRKREPGEVGDNLAKLWEGAVIDRVHWHFHRQLFKRYGIVLVPREFSKILYDIRKGKALIIERRPRGAAIVSVRIQSVDERVYLLARDQNLVTVWPPQKRLNAIRRQLMAEREAARREGRFLPTEASGAMAFVSAETPAE